MVGPAVAMPFFTWIVQAFAWRNSFFILAAMGLIPLVLLWLFTTDHPHEHRGVNEAELRHIREGLQSEAEAEASFQKTGLWSTMKAFIGNYRFWLLTCYYFCSASIFWGTMAWLPSYLKAARGFSWAAMGVWAALPYFLGIVSILLSGYISDKAGRRAPFNVVSMAGAIAGIYFGAHAGDNNTAALLLSLGIASLGIGLPSIWTMVQQIVPKNAVGAGAGVMNGISNGGSAFAPVIIGYCISLTGNYTGGLMFLVGLGLLGALSMVVLAAQRY
jgi:sugar phosphate permease